MPKPQTITQKILAAHCGKDYVEPGELIMARVDIALGNDITAPLAIKASGIYCVIGKSFARIFFRNAINIGLPLLESVEAVDDIKQGDLVKVDLASGRITNHTSGRTFQASPYPEFMLRIVEAGGLVERPIEHRVDELDGP